MKRNFIVGILAVASLSFISSCKDDEETPITGIEFEAEEQEVTESDGTVESFHPDLDEDGVGRIITAKLVFDRTLAKDAVLEFDIDGSARENASSTQLNDFEIVEEGENVTIDGNNITITKGATEAVFSVRVFEDYSFEYEQDSPLNDDDIPYETIEITLESVVSGPAKLGVELEHVVKILEDDSYVYMEWNPGDQTGTVGDVDMDLFIHIDGQLAGVSNYTNDEFESELLVIPAGFPDATYGMSYVYKSGTSNDLDFISEILNFGGTITTTGGETGVVYTSPGKYTLANINAYNEDDPSAQIEQTMVKSGLNYTDVTEITIPDAGSRIISKSSVTPHSRISREKLLKAKVKVLTREF